MCRASSEWIVEPLPTDGSTQRYALTPETVARTIGRSDVPLQAHSVQSGPGPTPYTPRDTGTQVLLRKRLVASASESAYELLFDGRVSQLQADDDTEHVLPHYRSIVHEDSSGRQVAAPVYIGLLVEDGARSPDMVKVQVVQKTFVGNTQVDEGTEIVLSEYTLSPTTPSQVESPALVVGYPVALAAPATIRIHDRSKTRSTNDANRRKFFAGVVKAGIEFVTGNLAGVLRALYSGGAYLQLPAALVSLGILGFGNTLFAAGTAGAVRTAAGAIFGGVTSLAAVDYANNFFTRKFADVPDASARTVDVAVQDLPGILRRVGGYQRGGVRSNFGEAQTVQALQAARRWTDAIVLQTIAALEIDRSNFDGDKERQLRDRLRTEAVQQRQRDGATLTDAAMETEAIDDIVETEFRRFETLAKGYESYNRIDFDQVTSEAMKARGYLETTLRIHVVDAHAGNGRQDRGGGHQTWHIRSDRSFEAGLVASGYGQLGDELDEAVQSVANTLRYDTSTSSTNTPLLSEASRIDNLPELLVGRILRIGTEVNWPRVDELVTSMRAIVAVLKVQLSVLVPRQAITAEDFEAAYTQPAALRLLPHVLRPKNAAGLSMTLDDNDGIATKEASATEPTRADDGLRAVATASASTLRIIRQAVAQCLERNDVADERPRWCLRVAEFAVPRMAQPLLDRRRIDGDWRTNQCLESALVYAPRMPLPVIDALAIQAAHPRLEEAQRIEWLSRPLHPPTKRHEVVVGNQVSSSPGASIAQALGIQPDHEGELVAGAVAELALRDILRRVSGSLVPAPSRADLMTSAMHAAIEQMHQAAALGQQLLPLRLEQRGKWLHPSDAVFETHPGGDVLRMVLLESAVFREWAVPWPRTRAAVREAEDALAAERATIAAQAQPASATDAIAEEVVGAAQAVNLPVPLVVPEPKPTRHLDRFVVLEANARSRPVGVASLTRLLVSMKALRKDTDVTLLSMPFLAPQTCRWHVPGALPPLGWRPSSNQDTSLAARHQRYALAALGAQLTAAHASTCRVAVLGSALGLETRHWRAIVRESACARPVVGLAIATGRLDEVLDAVIDTAEQPELSDTPPSHSVFDNVGNTNAAEWLAKRLALLRFDIRALAEQPALANPADDPLLSAFAELSVDTHDIQYLCAYGGGFVAELQPTMGRAIEDVPVYLQLATPTTTPIPVAPSTIVQLTPHVLGNDVATDPEHMVRDHLHQHPLVLSFESVGVARDVLRFHFAAVDMPRVLQSTLDDGQVPSNLRSCWTEGMRVRDTTPLAYANGVGAANGVSWNVERLVQCLLVLAGRGHTATTTVAMLKLPPPPAVEPVTLLPKPTPPKALLSAQRASRLLALSVTTSQTELRDVLLGLQRASDGATLATVLQTGDVAIASASAPDTTKARHIAALLEFAKDYEPQATLNALLERAAADDDALVRTEADAATTGTPALVLRREALRKYRAATETMQSTLQTTIETWSAATRPLQAETQRRVDAAAAARRHTLAQWPMVAAVAHAIAGSLLASVPALQLDRDALEDDAERADLDAARARFDQALAAAHTRGLKAAPLSELAAAVARV